MDNQDRIAELEQELGQLKAQNAEFRDALQLTYNNVSYVFVRDLLEKSTAACLAEHDIQFLTRLKDKCEGDHPHWGRTHIFIGEQIEILRQQPKEPPS